MPVPHRRSIYRFTSALYDAEGLLYLSEAPPFRYVDLPDNIEHTVVRGDTWSSIAARHYGAIYRDDHLAGAELIAKVIADFQPEWVEDMTILPVAGTRVYLPSLDTIETRIFNESRRAEYDA